MLDLTEKARAHFAKLLKQGECVVFGVKASGCSGLRYDLTVVADTINTTEFERLAGDLPFYVKKVSKPYIKDLTIDLMTEGLQSKVVYINPNETAKCGCGESFAV